MATTQAERDARKKTPPSSFVDRLWIASFFFVGASIGILFTIRAIDNATSTLIAVISGATVGGFGSWFAFFATLRLVAVLTSPLKDQQNRHGDVS